MTATLGDLRGRRLLDLGCGHGWLAGIVARAGAEVVGVDGSDALVTIARRRHPGLRFEVADLTEGLPAGLGSFDVVISHMVLMDLPALDVLLADVAAALTPGGVLLVSILHPSFFGQQIGHDSSLEPTEHGRATGLVRQVRGYLEHEQWWIDSFGGHTHYHRPLSWYVNSLTRAGLAVTALDEPPSSPQHERPVQEWTAYERWFADIPTMLAFTAHRWPPGWGGPREH
nr:class I SAM-dependent methyltransferase [Kineococcus siccus]